jgi:hypothetical protein
MYELSHVTEFLLQSSFRNPTEFYYKWIVTLCMMYDVWWLDSVSGADYVLTYFDMFYIQWHHLAKKDLWNKVYMNECLSLISTRETATHFHENPWRGKGKLLPGKILCSVTHYSNNNKRNWE